jgi:hypothetical protein
MGEFLLQELEFNTSQRSPSSWTSFLQ